ncbi:putative chromosome partitioning protein parB [Escherichia coli P0302308.12]|nr:putative chromosome partitioning protein parB [Escherichia coli P0302308.12]
MKLMRCMAKVRVDAGDRAGSGVVVSWRYGNVVSSVVCSCAVR